MKKTLTFIRIIKCKPVTNPHRGGFLIKKVTHRDEIFKKLTSSLIYTESPLTSLTGNKETILFAVRAQPLPESSLIAIIFSLWWEPESVNWAFKKTSPSYEFVHKKEPVTLQEEEIDRVLKRLPERKEAALYLIFKWRSCHFPALHSIMEMTDCSIYPNSTKYRVAEIIF